MVDGGEKFLFEDSGTRVGIEALCVCTTVSFYAGCVCVCACQSQMPTSNSPSVRRSPARPLIRQSITSLPATGHYSRAAHTYVHTSRARGKKKKEVLRADDKQTN